MSQNIVTVPPGADYFTIERSFDAPRRLVWKCYTEPHHLARFWGPGDAKITATIDLRVGGVWRTLWTYSNGGEYGYTSVYLELVSPCASTIATRPTTGQAASRGYHRPSSFQPLPCRRPDGGR